MYNAVCAYIICIQCIKLDAKTHACMHKCHMSIEKSYVRVRTTQTLCTHTHSHLLPRIYIYIYVYKHVYTYICTHTNADTLATHKSSLLLVCTAAGFARGMSDPLFFELTAESAYPQSGAGTAGSVLTFGYHVALAISLFQPASVLKHWALSAMAVSMGVCALLVTVARVQYRRR